jgi:hypothetical protein
MSGILDSKSRVLDTIITQEGRSQLSQGGIDISYVTFTDNGTFYKADLASGSQDATARIYLESSLLPQDSITFQADDNGNVQPFANDSDVSSAGGQILDYSFAPVSSATIGSVETMSSLTGNAFATAADTLVGASPRNFAKLRIIASIDPVFEDAAFALGPNQVTFNINATRPIAEVAQYSTHISALDSLFADPRFANVQNFRFLPPVNKLADRSLDRSDPQVMSNYVVGYYEPFGRTHVDGLSYQQVMSELQYYQNLGYMQTINIDPTSLGNRLVGQFFEKGYGTLKKLDVINFGTFPTGNSASPVASIFFVGKVEVDEKGTDTFLHLFTLVFGS